MSCPRDLTFSPFASPVNCSRLRCMKSAAAIGYAYRHAKRHLTGATGYVLPGDRPVLLPLVSSLMQLGARIRPSELVDLHVNVDSAPADVASLIHLLVPLTSRSTVWDLPAPQATYVRWPRNICLDELITSTPTPAEPTVVSCHPLMVSNQLLPGGFVVGPRSKEDIIRLHGSADPLCSSISPPYVRPLGEHLLTDETTGPQVCDSYAQTVCFFPRVGDPIRASRLARARDKSTQTMLDADCLVDVGKLRIDIHVSRLREELLKDQVKSAGRFRSSPSGFGRSMGRKPCMTTCVEHSTLTPFLLKESDLGDLSSTTLGSSTGSQPTSLPPSSSSSRASSPSRASAALGASTCYVPSGTKELKGESFDSKWPCELKPGLPPSAPSDSDPFDSDPSDSSPPDTEHSDYLRLQRQASSHFSGVQRRVAEIGDKYRTLGRMITHLRDWNEKRDREESLPKPSSHYLSQLSQALNLVPYDRIFADDELAAIQGRFEALVVLRGLQKRPELNFRLGILARDPGIPLHMGLERLAVSLFEMDSLICELGKVHTLGLDNLSDGKWWLSVSTLSPMSVGRKCLCYVEAFRFTLSFLETLEGLLKHEPSVADTGSP